MALASRTIDFIERKNLLALARQALLAAEQLPAKAAAYNLACACALDVDFSGCRRWLEKSQADLHLPPKGQVLADPDLAIVRDEPWFRELLS